jgi:hypothetical protein
MIVFPTWHNSASMADIEKKVCTTGGQLEDKAKIKPNAILD